MVTSHFKEFVISFEEEKHKTGFLLRLSLDPPSAIHKASENMDCVCCGNRLLPVLCIH